MSQFKLDIPLEGKWERIVFNTIDRIIPSDLMLSELIYSPSKDPFWAINIFREYQSPEADKLKGFFDAGDIPEQLPNGFINTSMWDKKHYTIASLRLYELPQRKPDPVSEATLRHFSNCLVSTIGKGLTNPTEFDNIEKIFCAKNSVDWNVIRYHRAVIDYCLQILPHPMNYVPNIDKDSALSLFLPEQQKHWEATGEILQHPNSDLAAYEERKEEAQRRTAILFSEYRHSRSVLCDFSYLIGMEHPEIYQNRFDLNYSTVTSNRSQRRIKKPTEKVLLLCRCEFCYRFRTSERSRGTTNYAWHCQMKECVSAYAAWRKRLKRETIKLETLYS